MASGYDLSVSTFSPDGKVFQVDYACKAVENGAMSLAAVFRDGVVLAAEKWQQTPLVLKQSRSRIFKLDEHACAIVTGSLPDGKNLIERARDECKQYKSVWGIPIPGTVLADRMGLYVHGHTAVWSTRPVGASLMIGVHERRRRTPFPGSNSAAQSADKNMDGDDQMGESSSLHWSLWLIDPTGAAYKYKANSQGKGAAGAKTDLEKIEYENLTAAEGVKELTKILYKQHDDNAREKRMTVEIMKLQTSMPFEVTGDELQDAERTAQEYLDSLDTA